VAEKIVEMDLYGVTQHQPDPVNHTPYQQVLILLHLLTILIFYLLQFLPEISIVTKSVYTLTEVRNPFPRYHPPILLPKAAVQFLHPLVLYTVTVTRLPSNLR
jgi:hypothetical protein